MTTSKARPRRRPKLTPAQQKAKFEFDQGCSFELHQAIRFLRGCDGIGSGVEAAAALERKEHRR